jgi:hypothetical protein
LYNAHLILQVLLGGKNIAKGLSIPEFELLPKIINPLLESVHIGAIRYLCLPPPPMDFFMEIQVAELELFKP